MPHLARRLIELPYLLPLVVMALLAVPIFWGFAEIVAGNDLSHRALDAPTEDAYERAFERGQDMEDFGAGLLVLSVILVACVGPLGWLALSPMHGRTLRRLLLAAAALGLAAAFLSYPDLPATSEEVWFYFWFVWAAAAAVSGTVLGVGCPDYDRSARPIGRVRRIGLRIAAGVAGIAAAALTILVVVGMGSDPEGTGAAFALFVVVPIAACLGVACRELLRASSR